MTVEDQPSNSQYSLRKFIVYSPEGKTLKVTADNFHCDKGFIFFSKKNGLHSTTYVAAFSEAKVSYVLEENQVND